MKAVHAALALLLSSACTLTGPSGITTSGGVINPPSTTSSGGAVGPESVPGSASVTNVNITINPAQTNVFFRLVYP